MKRITLILCAGLFFVPGGLWAAKGGGEYVPARAFAGVVEREIDGARESVHLYLYLFSLRSGMAESPPARLARALVRARERGVRVEATLNGAPDMAMPFGAEPNAEAAEFLRAGGVEVYRSTGPLLHAKLLVVDGRTVVLGSSNWSATAFGHNAEAGAVIRSTEEARRALEDFKSLPRERMTAPEMKTFAVPSDLLLKGGAINRMVDHGDDGSLDVYLHLLRKKAEVGATVVLDRKALANELGMRGRTSSVNAQIQGVLRRLRDRYKLIAWTEAAREDPVVTVLEVPGPVVRVPMAYAEWGWTRKLTMRGKVFYLLGQRETAASNRSPQWTEDQRTLGKRYGLSEEFLSAGIMQLRRAKLLDVEYAPLSYDASTPRWASVYRHNPFYDPAVLEARFRALGVAHGADRLARARGIAAVVYADSDAVAVERLILLEKRLGKETVDEAVAVVQDKSGNNPKRSAGYLIGMLEGMGREGGF